MTDNLKDIKDKDNLTYFVRLKSEKLVAATYLVTNFLSDSDPIKWRLRKLALSLIFSHTGSHSSFGQNPERIKEILSLIAIARLNFGVSQMNFDILKDEYLTLHQAVLTDRKSLTDFSADHPISSVSNVPRAKSPDHQTPQPGPVSNARRDLVLGSIKGKGWLSINDIAQKLPNLGGKTVQRELVALAQAGLVKKEGERRWSRYLAV